MHDKTHYPMWAVNWSLDASMHYIAQNVLWKLGGFHYPFGLGPIAEGLNGAVKTLFNKYGTNFNLFNVNWSNFSYPQLSPP